MINNFITRWLFSIIYRKWLWSSYSKTYSKVIRVKGWRTALIERDGYERSTITPIFWGLK
jgi:hypothetical protein